ncbi:hypothetical protein LTR28_011509 [Elasticomyces elasticus]|nr:hypothetical protein LTR28_011509 [Elasticomyces elasticus]
MSFRLSATKLSLRSTTFRTTHAARFLTTSQTLRSDVPPPNAPPSAKQAGRDAHDGHLSKDKQSSASTDEHKTGDDHPAKQPDGQQTPESSTGIEMGDGKGVKAGKEGMGARSDRDSEGK